MKHPSDVYDVLGLDPEALEWQDLAICKDQPISLFYEDYEGSSRTARVVDQMCFSCPVRNFCLQAGVENSEWGVWGGVYLVSGRMDDAKNAHKTEEDWKRIREGIE